MPILQRRQLRRRRVAGGMVRCVDVLAMQIWRPEFSDWNLHKDGRRTGWGAEKNAIKNKLIN